MMPYINDKGNLRVAVLGAAGGIGHSLSLLLKTQLGRLLQGSDHGDDRLELALYDIAADVLAGVTADLSHVNTPVLVKHYVPSSREDTSALDSCLEGASVVVIPAGVPRKPGMTRDDLISINAKIVGGLAAGIARVCDLSRVFVLVISNPVNSLVPVVLQEIIKQAEMTGADSAGVERRVFGVTQLDLVRASTFIQELTQYDGNRVPEIPVIGGHSGETIVPLFGKAQRELGFSDEQRAKLVHRVQYGGDEIVEAKKGAGSATLSMAYAGYEITSSFVELLLGNQEKIKVTVYASLVGRDGKPIAKGADEILEVIDGIQYFAVPVEVEAGAGVIRVDSSVLQEMDSYDRDNLLPVCISGLRKNIESGLSLAS